MKNFKAQYKEIDSAKELELFGSEERPVYPFRNKAQNLDINNISTEEKKKKLKNFIRAYRNDFNTLKQYHWFEEEKESPVESDRDSDCLTKKKPKKLYQKKEKFSQLIVNNFFKDNEFTEEDETSESSIYALNYDFTDFATRFHKNSNNSRLIITSEYATKSENEQILDDLHRNWFGSDIKIPKPILLKAKAQTFSKPKIVYPVNFVYIQRAPYLYFIEGQNNSISWNGIRSDRITNIKLLPWEDSEIPEVLQTLKKNNNLPDNEIIKQCLEIDRAIGSAFWQKKKMDDFKI